MASEARPTENPKWATGKAYNPAGAPSGDVIAPTAGKRSDGWPAPPNSPLPYQTINFLWKILGDWAAHLRDKASTFLDLGDLVDKLTPGQSAFVDSWDQQGSDGVGHVGVRTVLEKVPVNDTGDGVKAYSVDTDGRFIVTLEGSSTTSTMNLVRYDRNDLAAGPVAGFPVTVSAAISPEETYKVVTNGTHIAVSAGEELFLYLVDGTFEWKYPHGGDIFDICMDNDAVFLVGVQGALTNGENPNVRKVPFNAATGGVTLSVDDELWHYETIDPGTAVEDMFACDTDGVRLYVGGFANSPRSSVFALNAVTGQDVVADPAVAWVGGDQDTVAQRQLRCDGARVYVIEDVSATDTLRIRGAGDGIKSPLEQPLPALVSPLGHSALDQDFFHYASAGVMCSVCKYTLATVSKHYRRLPGAGINIDIFGIATDGDRVFVAGEPQDNALPPTGDDAVERLYKAGGPLRWMRVDPVNAKELPMRTLVVPEGQ